MEGDKNLQLDLPPEANHYSFRIGGHTHIAGKLKLGTLKHKNGHILKPLIKDDIRSARELAFYQQVFENSELDPIYHELKQFLPSFYGTWETAIDGTDVKYLCIEDACGKFQKPSILDVKIGAIAYEPNAPKEKIESMKKKYPFAEAIGFRILGMKVYDHWKQVYVSENKKFGLSLTPETVNAVRYCSVPFCTSQDYKIAKKEGITFHEFPNNIAVRKKWIKAMYQKGIGKFFNQQFGQINCLIVSGILHKLLRLKSWFAKQRRLVLISSSLLLMYESTLSPWITWLDECNIHIENTSKCKQSKKDFLGEFPVLHYKDCSLVLVGNKLASKLELKQVCSDCKLSEDVCAELGKNNNLLRISLIDFAHVLPTTQEDTNYIFGLNNFISHLHILLNTYLETFT